MIPYGRQDITEQDADAVRTAVLADLITQGETVPRFESAVAAYCGAAHGVAANSGTSALHLACMALDVGPGDLVWTSPITFVASANCARYCGADIDFVDIDPDTYNMDVDALAVKLRAAANKNRLPKVVIPVHLCGQSCDMQEIRRLSGRFGFSIIEDACHAMGGRYQGTPIGNGTFSDITVFSFHPVKHITTIEGGMALTNSADLADRMRRCRTHGITRNEKRIPGEWDGPWYYQQLDLGFNYRLNDVQAALGLSQLCRLDDYVAKRRCIASIYGELLMSMPVRVQRQPEFSESSHHLYVIRLELEKIPRSRREVFEAMRNDGIGVNVHYIPVHTQPYYSKMGFMRGDFPRAERYYAEALTLPLFPALTTEQVQTVVGSLKRAIQP